MITNKILIVNTFYVNISLTKLKMSDRMYLLQIYFRVTYNGHVCQSLSKAGDADGVEKNRTKQKVFLKLQKRSNDYVEKKM